MKDTLEIIFEMQKALNDYIIEKRGLEFPQEVWIQKRSMALIDEVMELNNEVNYKWWKNAKEIDFAAVKEELVDILHFYVGMCIDAGLSASELFEIYLKKNEENYLRQKGLSSKEGYKVD